MLNRPKRIVSLLLAAVSLCFASCTQPAPQSDGANNSSLNSTVNPDTRATREASEKPLQPLPQQVDIEKAKAIKDANRFDLVRSSKNKNESGLMIPPYDSAEVMGSLRQQPQAGDKVTIVPLVKDVQPFLLAVREVKANSYGCTEEDEKEFWDVMFDPITARQILDYKSVSSRSEEFPFEVVAIYPAIDYAKFIDRAELKEEWLPSNTFPETSEAAIDIDGDDKPDILLFRYCCSKPSRPAAECDLTCSKQYRRSGGKWELVEENQPC